MFFKSNLDLFIYIDTIFLRYTINSVVLEHTTSEQKNTALIIVFNKLSIICDVQKECNSR